MKALEACVPRTSTHATAVKISVPCVTLPDWIWYPFHLLFQLNSLVCLLISENWTEEFLRRLLYVVTDKPLPRGRWGLAFSWLLLGANNDTRSEDSARRPAPSADGASRGMVGPCVRGVLGAA
jgi:hypothetical protein